MARQTQAGADFAGFSFETLGRVPKWSGARTVVDRIASSLIPSVAIVHAAAPRVMQPQEMTAVLAAPARAASPAASQVAMAPAAMSALIEAQEHMAGDTTPTDRSLTGQKIDHLLARMANAPASAPTAGGFSVQMLMAARQQLRETYA
jgi:hypothetical protein